MTGPHPPAALGEQRQHPGRRGAHQHAGHLKERLAAHRGAPGRAGEDAGAGAGDARELRARGGARQRALLRGGGALYGGAHVSV